MGDRDKARIMMNYKYILREKSPLFKALQHVLQMFSIPADSINVKGEHFAVKVGPVIHVGILPLLSTLRIAVPNAELRSFIGADPDILPLVNQWVTTASFLSAYREGEGNGTCTPFAKHVLLEIEKNLESFDLQKSFLAGTSRATVADLLLYAAIHGHRGELAEKRPSTTAWLLYTQQDAYVTPIVSESAALPLATAGASKGTKPVYVKPSEEEIVRRRLEKAKEKEVKLAQTGIAGAAAASSSSKAIKAPKEGKKLQEGPAALDPNRLDIRVGRFTNVKRHPDADRLYVEEMDIGSEKRTIVSGLVEHYTTDEVEGTLCLVVCNMKPKLLKGVASHGMVLCASNESTLRLVRPPEEAKPGDRILFCDVFNPSEFQETKQLSGNMMSELIGFLRTDEEGIVRWRETPAQHINGVLKIPEVTNAIVK